MRLVNYKNFEWYVIKEDEKEKLLFMKDGIPADQVKKYFTNEQMVDSDNDVRFNKDYTNPWWRDSYIRQVLNTKFLEDLDLEDLNVMETTVELNDEKVSTKDYVRLITKEEVEKLPLEVKKTNRQYGYWTMSPSYFIGSNARASVFFVYGSSDPGYLSYAGVGGSGVVRPVVSLKSNVQLTDVTSSIASDHDCDVTIEEIEDIYEADTEDIAEKLNEVIKYINESKVDNDE